jgi:hypothetical protein
MTEPASYQSGLRPPGDWDVGAVYEHFSSLIVELNRQLEIRYEAMQDQLDRRFETQLRERSIAGERAEERLAAEREYARQNFVQIRRESEKFEAVVQERMVQLNKLREQAIQDRSLFATQKTLDAQIAAIDQRVAEARDEARLAIPQIAFDTFREEWARWRERVEREMVRAPEYKESETSWGKWQDGVDEKLNALAVRESAVKEYQGERRQQTQDHRQAVQPWQLYIATSFVIMFTTVLVIVVNVLTTQ